METEVQAVETCSTKSLVSLRKSRLKNSQSTASAGFTKMAAAGIKLHPSCRARQEGFGLLFYDCKGPRLLFAATGNLLPADFYGTLRARDEFPAGTPDSAEKGAAKIRNATPGKRISP